MEQHIPVDALIQDFESHKQRFDKWKIDHKNAQGTTDYENYVAKFRQYEMEMNARISELQGRTTTVNESVDAQLHKLLAQCSKEEFILAFLHASAKDQTLIKTVTDALETITTPKNVPMLINSYGVRPILPSSSSSPAMISQSPLQHQGSPAPQIHIRPPKVQMTNYGLIPEGWTIDQAILRPERLPPPPKSYAEASKLPFFDIGGGN